MEQSRTPYGWDEAARHLLSLFWLMGSFALSGSGDIFYLLVPVLR